MYALQRDRRQMSPDDFPEQLTELLAYFEDDFPPDHPFARLAALPGAPGAPDVWLLGSSPQSAIWAGQLGLPYSVADFINPEGAANARLYRERFRAVATARAARGQRLRLGDLRRAAASRPSDSPPARGWRSRCCAAGS